MGDERADCTDCVLVVEDDEDNRETLREIVELAGCSAITAENGAEALKVLAHHRPCLVIVDLIMPVMSGAELIAVMKREPELSSLEVVVSTSAPERAPPGLRVLAKPVELTIAVDWIRRACRCTAHRAMTR